METTILDGYSNMEKGAYLGAIASIATADRKATEDEMEYLEALCESANLSAEQEQLITRVASMDVADEDLQKFLDVLKGSELRFSLVSDLIAFAQADQNYSEEEKQTVKKVADYLGVNQEQFAVLNDFTKEAVNAAPGAGLEQTANSPQGFLDNLGFGDKLKNAGINTNSLLKGALGIIGPMLLARMFSGGRSRRRSGGGGLLGGLLGGSSSGGGLLGGLGGLLAGGGLLGGLLGGGRGFGNAGGLLGRVLGQRR